MTQPLFYLGPEGSHSHQAALALQSQLQWQSTHSLKPAGSLFSLMEATAIESGSYGLIPVENALEGSVTEVLDALGLQRYPLQPMLECLFPIQHCLMALSDDQRPETHTITVLSHPQALGQCRQTLQERYGTELRCHPTTSTSEAARLVAQSKTTTLFDNALLLAIGTHQAALHYGLQVILADASDAPNNRTRFFLVTSSAMNSNSSLSLPAGLPVKTSLCLGIPDDPGSLVTLLQVFARYGINLCKIESRPSRRKLGEYYFYVDVSADLMLPEHAAVRKDLATCCTYQQMLRPYACLDVLDPVSTQSIEL